MKEKKIKPLYCLVQLFTIYLSMIFHSRFVFQNGVLWAKWYKKVIPYLDQTVEVMNCGDVDLSCQPKAKILQNKYCHFAKSIIIF